jgi:hypothetical protein
MQSRIEHPEKTMKRIAVVLVGCLGLVVMARRPAYADCRLVINVDRTASMMASTTGGTRCLVAKQAVKTILNAYLNGQDYDITKDSPSAETSVDYNRDCPCNAPQVQGNPGTHCTDAGGQDPYRTHTARRVMIREFQGDVMQPLRLWLDGEDPFLAVGVAIERLKNIPDWYDASGNAVDGCPGPFTPMAQAMCRAAFTLGGTPSGMTFVVRNLTDGEENYSDIVPIDDANNELRCRKPADDILTWQGTVSTQFTSRGIVTDNDLFGGLPLTVAASVLEPNGDARGRAAAAPGSSLAASPDEEFFAALAEATGGRFRFIDPTTPISSEITLIDSDGDTIPDFRDRCVGDCAADRDRDGIPDANDACPLLAEDGGSPFRSDGCPDTDSDGIHDGADNCRTETDDHLAPFPRDGCRSAHWSASATPNLPFRGLVCTSRFVHSPTGAASLAKLSIAGSHSSRAGLRGVLFHNIDLSEAFPVGTFPAGAGTFGFTDRPIDVAPSSATGLWTLCITDTNGFGASGVLNSWSIHD